MLRPARAGDHFTAFHANALLRTVGVDTRLRARRLAGLRIEQHHVRRVEGRGHLDDAARLFRCTRLAVLLHDVDTFHLDAARLGVHLKDLPFLPLVVATHHADGVTLRHVDDLARGLQRVPASAEALSTIGLVIHVLPHLRAPLVPATQSSCTASRAARAPPVRRYGSPWAHHCR